MKKYEITPHILHFRFVSLTPTCFYKAPPLFNRTSNSLPSKLVLKKSYLLLLWLSYLNEQIGKKVKIKISVLKKNFKLLTFAKAPMAHKKNSKEQFKLLYYPFKVSFFFKNHILLKVWSTLHVTTIVKKNLNFFETNLFWARFFYSVVPLSDNYFYTYKVK